MRRARQRFGVSAAAKRQRERARRCELERATNHVSDYEAVLQNLASSRRARRCFGIALPSQRTRATSRASRNRGSGWSEGAIGVTVTSMRYRAAPGCRLRRFDVLAASLIATWLLAGSCEERHAARCKLECEARGACTGKGDRCVATDPDDCLRSRACRDDGKCALVADRCEATESVCAKFAGCAALGRCGVKDGACAATSDAHCKNTENCKTDGLCSAVNGACTAQGDDCRSARACTEYARCTVRGNACVAASSADCELSKMCSRQGYCTFVEGRCQLAAQADCEKTTGCKLYGSCHFVQDTHKSGMEETPGCVIGSNADCRRAEVCKTRGYCRKGTRACTK